MNVMAADDDTITVGFSQVGAESDWRTANTESMKSTFSEDNGYELIFDDAQQKQENQLTAIRNFIQQEVDYIVLAPVTETGWDLSLIHISFRIKEGTKAGVVFGANDARLMDISKNELQVEGENDIRFVLNIAKSPAVIEVYRRGYCKEDVADTPLYELGTKDLKTDRELITEENKHDFHKLTIEVEGNGVYTYLDDCVVDEVYVCLLYTSRCV